MAKLNLNVKGLPSRFTSDVKELHNGCISVYEFESYTTPNSELTVKSYRLNNSLTDYDSIEIDIEGKWVPFNGEYNKYKTNSSGITKYRVIVGNSLTGCNTAAIRIGDTFNSTYDTKYFVRCIEGGRCSNNIGPLSELYVDDYTKFNVYINTTAPIPTTAIRNLLSSYYSNSLVAADSITIKQTSNKSTLELLNAEDAPYLLTADNLVITADSGYVSTNDVTTGKTIVIVIQEDALPVYHGSLNWDVESPRTSKYDGDLKSLKKRLNAYGDGSYRGAVIQIDSQLKANTNGFKSFLKAVQYGGGSYIDNSLSGIRDIKYYYDIRRNGTNLYYTNIVKEVLTDLRVSKLWGG